MRSDELWENEKTEKLKTLYTEGLTYSQIAMSLGITRSAVAGKLVRLGLRRQEKISIEELWAKRREREQRRKKAKRERQNLRIVTLRPNTSKTSVIYRRGLCLPQEITSKNELRALLAQAMQNTAGMAV